MWSEIERLRTWRHDHVEPALAACRELPKAIESLGGRLAALEERLTAVDDRMDAMIEADKIGKAVASAMQEQHGGILTRRQRWVAYTVAFVTVVAGLVNIAQHFV